MPYRFRGVLFGFEGPHTLEADAPRLRNHLEAFALDSVYLFRLYAGTDRPLPELSQSSIWYVDPGNVDPPLQDCVVTYLDAETARAKGERGGAACGALSIYTVAWYRVRGEHATFHIRNQTFRNEQGRLVSRWHICTRRANGTIEDWSRMRGMKG